jgi:hypothetical protein
MSKAAELAALIGSQSALSDRNLVINGAMQVAQRGDVTGITGANKFGGADRFATNGTAYGTVSLVQEADAPEGFAKSQRVKFTTARSTTGAGDHFVIGTRLEGQDLQRFKKGTSNAESMTVSFYAKASQATTIQLELFDADNNRHAGKEFAITTSWARYSYSFAGDTTGAFDNDNAVSLYVFFWLGAGTTFTSGTNPDGSWISNDNSRRVHSDVGTTFMDTLNAEFNLTGVQLEVGEQATPFEHRSFHDELRRCKRYFERFAKTLTSVGQNSEANCGLWSGMSRSGNSGNNQGVMTYQTKRTNPSISVSSAAHINGVFPISPFAASLSSFGIDGNAGIDNCFVNAANNASTAPSSDCGSSGVMGDSSGTLDIDAEL